MYYFYLSMLKDILTEKQCEKLGEYFCTLTSNTQDLITVSKISKVIEIDVKTALQVLNSCEKCGYLIKQYGVRCPECDALIKMISVEEYNGGLFPEMFECYDCGEHFKLNDDNVIVFYKLNIDVSPFAIGQQKAALKNKQSTSNQTFAAPEDSLSYQKKIAESLDIIANNQKHEQICRKNMENAAREDRMLEGKALEKYKINGILVIVASFIAYLILAFVIVKVYKTYGYNKISIVLTFGSSLITFGFNHIIYWFFPKDIDIIKMNLKNKQKNKD